MESDIIRVNFKVWALLSFIFILCVSLNFVFWIGIKGVGIAILISLQYYFIYCWTYFIWMFIQNFLFKKFGKLKLRFYILYATIFISLFAFVLWDESYFKEEFYQFFGLANFMSITLTYLLYKYVSPLYIDPPSKGRL
jgi:hypothetical protein